MFNRHCPNCNMALRPSEYNRNRQSYLTYFDCPGCGTRLCLPAELYLWILLVFQVLPVKLFVEQQMAVAEGLVWLNDLSSLAAGLGVIMFLFRFRYVVYEQHDEHKQN